MYVSDKQIVILGANGVTALFEPGVPRALRSSLVAEALARGVKEVGAAEVAPVVAPKAKTPAKAKEAPAVADVEDVLEPAQETMTFLG
jgi:hypothetical protein